MTKIKLITTKGTINLLMFDDDAPLTVASFLYLAKRGYYNGLAFHRVIPDFMIQGGCPTGTGMHGPKQKGINSFPFKGKDTSYPFSDEFKSGRTFDKPGVLAMANAGPGTNGSQFFITHIPTPHLNNKHTIFGAIISSEDQKIVNSIKKGDKIQKIEIL